MKIVSSYSRLHNREKFRTHKPSATLKKCRGRFTIILSMAAVGSAISLSTISASHFKSKGERAIEMVNSIISSANHIATITGKYGKNLTSMSRK